MVVKKSSMNITAPLLVIVLLFFFYPTIIKFVSTNPLVVVFGALMIVLLVGVTK